jgi:hypothetical protein
VRVVTADTVTIMDFVVADPETARRYIREGALNGVELLEEAGLTTAEAEAELKRIEG